VLPAWALTRVLSSPRPPDRIRLDLSFINGLIWWQRLRQDLAARYVGDCFNGLPRRQVVENEHPHVRSDDPRLNPLIHCGTGPMRNGRPRGKPSKPRTKGTAPSADEPISARPWRAYSGAMNLKLDLGWMEPRLSKAICPSYGLQAADR